MEAPLPQTLLQITSRTLPVFFAFASVKAMVVAWQYDRMVPFATAAALLAIVLYIADRTRLEGLLRRVVPLWDIGPVRFVFALILGAALLVIHFAAPASLKPFILTLLIPAFVICYIWPGYIYDPVRALRPAPRPRLWHVRANVQGSRPKAWRKVMGWSLLMVLVLGGYGWFFSTAVPSAAWLNLSVPAAALFTVLLTVTLGWIFWQQNESRIDDIRRYIPDFAIMGLGALLIFGGAFHLGLTRAVPELWHMVVDGPVADVAHVVRKADARSGLRDCRSRMDIYVSGSTGATITLCGLNAAFVEGVLPGDILTLRGRTSFFGQTIEGARIERQPR